LPELRNETERRDHPYWALSSAFSSALYGAGAGKEALQPRSPQVLSQWGGGLQELCGLRSQNERAVTCRKAK